MYEFYQIAESLSKAGITAPQRAASIKPCPKGKPRLTVFIDAEGMPVDLELQPRQSQDDPPFERWAPDNHMAFPTFAVDPLYVVSDKALFNTFRQLCKETSPDKHEALLEVASALLEAIVPCWTEKLTKKLGRQFLGGDLLLGKTGPLPPSAAAFSELARRCSLLTCEKLGDYLRGKFTSGIRTSPLDWAFVASGIIGIPVDKKIPVNTLLITLELDDWMNYPSLASSPEVFDSINNCLLAEGSQSTEAIDAFGLPLAGHLEPMPKLLLPESGEKPLRSMFGDVPANSRYHRSGSDSFPVGNEARMRMLSAGKWITAPEREGKTWAFLTHKTKLGRTSINPTLVLITPKEMPPIAPAFGQLFAPVSQQTEQASSELGFAAIAADVAQAVRGIWKGDLSVPIQVSVITSFDKGRYKLLMSDTFTAGHLIDSARHWQEGCLNTPPISFRVSVNRQIRHISPDLPLPSELIPLFATVWLRSGSDFRTTRQVAQDLPARLLLSAGPLMNDTAMNLLRQHVDDQAPVLLALGLSRFKGREVQLPKSLPFRIEILPSVLGLLLYKVGRVVEDYMQDAYFLVGRILNLADTLHEQYCLAIRNGDVPPALLGNSLMRTALENPVDAMNQLADRILVYQSWARSSQKENSRLAKWALGQFGGLSEALKGTGIPEVVTPAGKAELLLGYLAGAPKKTTTAETSPNEV